MSRDHRDQRGGHVRPKIDRVGCYCCEAIPPETRSRSRRRRNRALDKQERRADDRA